MNEVKVTMPEAGTDVTHDPTQIRIHDFGHYFVTLFYAVSENNIKATQAAARHRNTRTTSRYAS
jgi:hypothetical protein